MVIASRVLRVASTVWSPVETAVVPPSMRVLVTGTTTAVDAAAELAAVVPPIIPPPDASVEAGEEVAAEEGTLELP